MQPKWGAVTLLVCVAACGGGGGGGGGGGSGSSSVSVGAATTTAPTNAQVSLGAAAGLSYADFGYWNTPEGEANFYASGTPTPASQLPPSGANIAATYDGVYAESHTAYGAAGIPEPAGSDTGAVQINANFGTQSVSMSFTSGWLRQHAVATTVPGGSITSNGLYAVNASDFSSLIPIIIHVNGAFYGPSLPSQAPPETVGTFSGTIGSAGNLNGTITSAGTITGSFGAHR